MNQKTSDGPKIKSVLVTEASQKNTLGIVRALGKAEKKVYVLAQSKHDQSRFSKYCIESLLVKKLNKEQIMNFILQHKIDMVIPVGTTSIQFFSKNHSFFSNFVNFLIPSDIQIKTAMSKKMTLEIARELSVPIPKTIFPKNMEDAYQATQEVGFPCVMKWLYEVGENVVDYACDQSDFKKKYDSMCLKHSFDESTGLPMVQEFIKGIGVGYFALFYKGKLVDSYQHQRIREAPPSGGVSVCAKTVYYKDLDFYSTSILSHLQWNGVAMVEFKMLEDGSLVLMEINPKFWGSHDLGLEAGKNFPLKMIKLLETNDMSQINMNLDFPKDLKFYWPLDGDIKFMFSDKSRFIAVINDVLDPKVKSNLSFINDPLPTLIEILSRIVIMCRNFFRKHIS